LVEVVERQKIFYATIRNSLIDHIGYSQKHDPIRKLEEEINAWSSSMYSKEDNKKFEIVNRMQSLSVIDGANQLVLLVMTISYKIIV
jgi:hypothetical protein